MPAMYYIVNVEAAIYRDDKWLIIRRSELEEHASGTLSLVGGKVDGITNCANVLEETLRREVAEEVGITVVDIQYLESKVFVTNDGKPVVDIVFLCRYCCGDARCVSEEEVAAVYWLTQQEIEASAEAPWYLKQTLALAEVARKSQSKTAKVELGETLCNRFMQRNY